MGIVGIVFAWLFTVLELYGTFMAKDETYERGVQNGATSMFWLIFSILITIGYYS